MKLKTLTVKISYYRTLGMLRRKWKWFKFVTTNSFDFRRIQMNLIMSSSIHEFVCEGFFLLATYWRKNPLKMSLYVMSTVLTVQHQKYSLNPPHGPFPPISSSSSFREDYCVDNSCSCGRNDSREEESWQNGASSLSQMCFVYLSGESEGRGEEWWK